MLDSEINYNKKIKSEMVYIKKHDNAADRKTDQQKYY